MRKSLWVATVSVACLIAPVAVADATATAATLALITNPQVCGRVGAVGDVQPTRDMVMAPGFGDEGFAVDTQNPEAQAWFDHGVRLRWAFEHSESVRAFRKARQLDPSCGMCAWGEAWAIGPNLNGGGGDDSLVGGSGSDWASYANATGSVTVDLSAATPNAVGADGEDLLSRIENIIGSNSDDRIVGDGGDNTILGGNGVDNLSGGAGNDWLDFNGGDEAFTRAGADSGNDTLIGGAGQDTLDLQSDWSFLSNSGNYSLYRAGSDTIWAQGWETVVCFAEGTRIVTPHGEDAVENLRAGDMVLAMRGGQAGFEPLRWVGFMDVAVPRNAGMAAKTAPILIKAGALAPGMPARDLRVSPDHAMEVDGHLIPAKHLVNGSSIIQEIWCKRVRYFHLELEAHGLLLSEGTWSESYFDDGNRHAFNNAALTGLFLDFEAGRSKGEYDHLACLPVLRQGLKLDEIHGRLALRAEEVARNAKDRRRA